VAGLDLDVWAARGAVMAMQQKASVNERMGFLLVQLGAATVAISS
jgi:hypothetical protein